MLAGREIEVGAVVAVFAEPALTVGARTRTEAAVRAAAPAEPTGS